MNDTFTVGGKTVVPFVKPTISAASAYVANDAVGGVMTFPVGNGIRRSGIIAAATLIDVDPESAQTDLYLFSHNITSVSDNQQFDPTDAEMLRCIGTISFGTSNYLACATATNPTVAHINGLAIPFVCPWGSLGISNITSSGGLIAVTTLVAHGLSTGAQVSIANVQGVTAANSTWTITVTSSTAFTLNSSTHSGTYVTGTGEVRVTPEEKNYNIYGQLVTRGLPTYTLATDLAIKLHILQD